MSKHSGGLFTPQGFTSPEEIRRRIGKTTSDQATAFGIQQANLFQDPGRRMAAQIGGAFGAGLAGGFGSRGQAEATIAEQAQLQAAAVAQQQSKKRTSLQSLVGKVTNESLEVFSKSGDFTDLVAMEKKKDKPTALIQNAMFVTGDDEVEARALLKTWKGSGNSFTSAMKNAAAIHPNDPAAQRQYVIDVTERMDAVPSLSKSDVTIMDHVKKKLSIDGQLLGSYDGLVKDDYNIYMDFIATEAKKKSRGKGAGGFQREMLAAHELYKGAIVKADSSWGKDYILNMDLLNVTTDDIIDLTL